MTRMFCQAQQTKIYCKRKGSKMDEFYKRLTEGLEVERMDFIFQEILESKEHDPRYESLISTYNELKQKSVEILEKRGDIKTAYQMGMKAGVIENRIMDIYEEETGPF